MDLDAMAREDGPPVARLQLVQPQSGFVCGSLPVPLDTGSFQDLVRNSESPMIVVRDRPSIPRYKFLPAETDLNNPPTNWLQFEGLLPSHPSAHTDDLPGSQPVAWGGAYLSHPIAKKGEALAVTGLAGYGDEVDVIAPADILKQIFKTPYSKARLSVAVHRVGRTLILNSGLDTDLEKVRAKQRNRKQMPRSLFSKFIHYSVQDACGASSSTEEATQSESSEGVPSCFGMPDDEGQEALDQSEVPSVLVDHGPHIVQGFDDEQTGARESQEDESVRSYVPGVDCRGSRSLRQRLYSGGGGRKGRAKGRRQRDQMMGAEDRSDGKEALGNDAEDDVQQDPCVDGEAERPRSSPEGFLRVLFWQFQHIRMLLGSDLLLFSNKEHAAVSLRLVELERQTSPLHWLDAWLDNVMASVPELAICYHRNGIVQGYELLKTDDIILLKGLSGDGNAYFHPHVVQKNASSVLQFLQKNCIRDPGTYWLRKNTGEDLMQLFDLTPDARGEEATADELPGISRSRKTRYSLPLAMLLYRLANRLSHSQYASDRRRCAQLFATCLDLLDEQHHPGVRANAHEQVARAFLEHCCALGPHKTLLLEGSRSSFSLPPSGADSVKIQEIGDVETTSIPVQVLSEEEVQVSVQNLQTISEDAADIPGFDMADGGVSAIYSLAGIQDERKSLPPVEGSAGIEESMNVKEAETLRGGAEGAYWLSSEGRATSVASSYLVEERELEESGPVVIAGGETGEVLPNALDSQHSHGRSDLIGAESDNTGEATPGNLSAAMRKSLILAESGSQIQRPNISPFPAPEDAVSARLRAVHHASQAIRSLRWQRHLFESSGDFLRSEGLLSDDPESLALCICGETNCLQADEFQQKPEGKVRELIALLGDSYVALGEAYKADGQLGRALRAAELACLILGPVWGRTAVLGKKAESASVSCSTASVSIVGSKDGSKSKPSMKFRANEVEDRSLPRDGGEGSGGVGFRRAEADTCGNVNEGIGGSESSAIENRFWGRLWCFVGDIYVDFQKQLVEGDIPLHQEATRCKELRISDDVVKEVRRLKKKSRQPLDSCSSCSSVSCTCLSDRANSGTSASSSNEGGTPSSTSAVGDGSLRRKRAGQGTAGKKDAEVHSSRHSLGKSGAKGEASGSHSRKNSNAFSNAERARKERSNREEMTVSTGIAVGAVSSVDGDLVRSLDSKEGSRKADWVSGEEEKNGTAGMKVFPTDGADRTCSPKDSVGKLSKVKPEPEIHSASPHPVAPKSSPEPCVDTSLFCFGRPMTVDWEMNLTAAAEYYAAAAAAFAEVVGCTEEREDALRKRGWVYNELGRRRLANKSVRHAEDAFQRAILAFREVKDFTNVVLVHCNLGHGRRAAAEAVVAEVGLPSSYTEKGIVQHRQKEAERIVREVRVKQAKRLYLEALHHYNEARKELLGLGENLEKSMSGLWTEVLTQFGHTYLRLGMLLAAEEVEAGFANNSESPLMDHDAASSFDIRDGSNAGPQSKGGGEDVVFLTAKDAMTKALVLYDTLGSIRRQECAYAHHQLACNHRDRALLIAAAVRQEGAVKKQKRELPRSRSKREAATWQQLRRYAALAEIHWQRALEVYKPQSHPDVFINIAIERADLCLATAAQTPSMQALEASFSYLLESRHVWMHHSPDSKPDPPIEEPSHIEGPRGATASPATCSKLCQRIQYLLKSMLSAAMAASRHSGFEKSAGSSSSQHSKAEGRLTVKNLTAMYRVALSLEQPPPMEELYAMWILQELP